MLIATVLFNPANKRRYQIDYPWLAENETITHYTAYVTPKREDDRAGIDVYNVLPLESGKAMAFMVTGLIDPRIGAEYAFELITETTLGQKNIDKIAFIFDEMGE